MVENHSNYICLVYEVWLKIVVISLYCKYYGYRDGFYTRNSHYTLAISVNIVLLKIITVSIRVPRTEFFTRIGQPLVNYRITSFRISTKIVAFEVEGSLAPLCLSTMEYGKLLPSLSFLSSYFFVFSPFALFLFRRGAFVTREKVTSLSPN